MWGHSIRRAGQTNVAASLTEARAASIAAAGTVSDAAVIRILRVPRW